MDAKTFLKDIKADEPLTDSELNNLIASAKRLPKVATEELNTSDKKYTLEEDEISETILNEKKPEPKKKKYKRVIFSDDILEEYGLAD